MASSQWGGRKVRRLTLLCLRARGTVCHLCGEPGADSPDHDPPREDLIRAGVPDPDALVYLWPSHWICNVRRGRRPITPELLATLRRQYLADQTRAAAALALSPRFKRRFSP